MIEDLQQPAAGREAQCLPPAGWECWGCERPEKKPAFMRFFSLGELPI